MLKKLHSTIFRSIHWS